MLFYNPLSIHKSVLKGIRMAIITNNEPNVQKNWKGASRKFLVHPRSNMSFWGTKLAEEKGKFRAHKGFRVIKGQLLPNIYRKNANEDKLTFIYGIGRH